MKPIAFQSSRYIPYNAEEIAAEIADLSRWPEFDGYGSLPGIASAAYEGHTGPMAGARIRVHNTDGSSHVETVEIWQPPQRIVMRLHEFTPPLSRIASHFVEEWRFEEAGNGTGVTRQLQLYPRSALARPVLWLISLLMRRAIGRHLDRMARSGRG
jgi:hypothetical protein